MCRNIKTLANFAPPAFGQHRLGRFQVEYRIFVWR